jgi:hypothetical protein
MSKNNEILNDFLVCMNKLVDKLHQTNKKIVDIYETAKFLDMENINKIKNELIEISGKIEDFNFGDIGIINDRFDEIENRINNLTTMDIIETNDEIIEQLNENTENLENK